MEHCQSLLPAQHPMEDIDGGFQSPMLTCMERQDPKLKAVTGTLKTTLLRSGLYGFYIKVRRQAHFPAF